MSQVSKLFNFNFDLVKLQQAIEAPAYRVPDNLSFKAFQEWMNTR